MNPTSNVSVSTESQTESRDAAQRLQTEQERITRRIDVVQRYLKNGLTNENSSVMDGHLVWVAPAAVENATRTDFSPLVDSHRSEQVSDDNVIRIPVVARRRVRIGNVRRLEPLASE